MGPQNTVELFQQIGCLFVCCEPKLIFVSFCCKKQSCKCCISIQFFLNLNLHKQIKNSALCCMNLEVFFGVMLFEQLLSWTCVHWISQFVCCQWLRLGWATAVFTMFKNSLEYFLRNFNKFKCITVMFGYKKCKENATKVLLVQWMVTSYNHCCCFALLNWLQYYYWTAQKRKKS